MNVKLIKVKVTIEKDKEKKEFYNYFLVLENGTKLAIKPNTYTTAKGTFVTNENILRALATDDLPF